jgi:O-antigen/teichoic acid export membrane protein
MELIKKLKQDDKGQMSFIGAAVGLLITLAIVVLIFYNIVGSLDTTSIDAKLDGTPAANATRAVMDQSATFFTIAPIIAIVIVAVVVIGYVQRIGSA